MIKISKIILGAEASMDFQKGICHFEIDVEGQDIDKELVQKFQNLSVEIAKSSAQKLADNSKKEVEVKTFKKEVTSSKDYKNEGTYEISPAQKKFLAAKKVPKDTVLKINSYKEFNDFVGKF